MLPWDEQRAKRREEKEKRIQAGAGHGGRRNEGEWTHGREWRETKIAPISSTESIMTRTNADYYNDEESSSGKACGRVAHNLRANFVSDIKREKSVFEKSFIEGGVGGLRGDDDDDKGGVVCHGRPLFGYCKCRTDGWMMAGSGSRIESFYREEGRFTANVSIGPGAGEKSHQWGRPARTGLAWHVISCHVMW